MKIICKLCKLIIRRPIDHAYCPGIEDESHLKEYDPDKEITQKIKIPKFLNK